MSKVLVTGGTGFIAGHCIKFLLERGYDVVTTVRGSAKGSKLQKAYTADFRGKLDYVVVEDVAKENAFHEAIKSIPDLNFVIHTASPFHYNVQDPVKDFLEPAIIGTTSILHAAKDHGPSVKRVVLLSSFAAVRDDTKPNPQVYDESCWNPITWEQAAQNPKKTYQGSKALSERAAWEFMNKEKPNFDLVTICPSLVFGPAAPHLAPGELSSLNTSNVRILDMLEGKMKESLAPTGFYSFVDVRDVAFAHVKALEVPEAGGCRFLVMTDYFSNKEVAEIISAMRPEFRELFPAKLEESDGLPAIKDRYTWNNQRSVEVLGIQYTSLATSVKDTVESLLRLRS